MGTGQRSGVIWPELFQEESTDADDEAVTNEARFASMGRRKKALADLDYEAKMAAIFAECHRILADDGVLTVMFTNKDARAWDALGSGSHHSRIRSGDILACRDRT